MKPDADLLIIRVQAAILSELGPALPAGYAQTAAASTAGLLSYVRHELEHGANLRANENAAIRALFADAAPLIAEPLRRELEEAAQNRDPDIRLSTLSEANARLKTLLIVLQTAVEESQGDAYREMERRILTLLRDFAAARIAARR